ncbi:MAG: hypothetical protein WCO28_08185, partial [Bacteroidota bacterium]
MANFFDIFKTTFQVRSSVVIQDLFLNIFSNFLEEKSKEEEIKKIQENIPEIINQLDRVTPFSLIRKKPMYK